MTIHIKDGGTWKEATVYVKDGGTWKAVSEGYIKDGGTWKQFLASRVTSNITISANTANYVLNTSKVTGYVAGKTDVTLTINSGVTVYSASTGSYAFTVDTSWATGDTITIINNGTILGKGGDGGLGGTFVSIGAGTSGGAGLLVQRAVSINNANRISGGGGGGGGGGWYRLTVGKGYTDYGGGGGGGGIGNGAAGAGGTSGMNTVGNAGTAGTLTSFGTGGSSGGGAGGNGGTYGSAGSNGVLTNTQSGASGGAGGAAVVGNSNITWIATGTRNGSIS